MNNLLLVVVSLSLSGSILACALFLLKPLLKKRISKTWQYYLWALVIARLLLPFSPEASLTGNLFQYAAVPAIRQEASADWNAGFSGPEKHTDGSTGWPDAGEAQIGDAAPGASGPKAGKGLSVPETTGFTLARFGTLLVKNLWLIWIAGALLLLVKKVTSYRSFLHFVRAGRKRVEHPEILDIYMTAAEELGVRRLPALYTHPVVSTPIQVGVIHPFIVLPEGMKKDGGLYYILCHELIHCRRKEYLYKWLVQVTLCLHWFNPVAYAVAREIDRACELACDEAVIRNLNREERKSYGELLLSAAENAGGYNSEIISVTLCENGRHLKERLGAILEFGKKPKFWVAAGVILTACLCAGAGLLGAYTAGRAVHTSIRISPSLSINLPLFSKPGEAVNQAEAWDTGMYDDFDFDWDWEDWYDAGNTYGNCPAFGRNGYDSYGTGILADQTLSLDGVETIQLRLNTQELKIRPAVDKNIRMVCENGWMTPGAALPQMVREDDVILLDTTRSQDSHHENAGAYWETILLYLPADYEKALEISANATGITVQQPMRLESFDLDLNAGSLAMPELITDRCEMECNASSVKIDKLTASGTVEGSASDIALKAVTITESLEVIDHVGEINLEMAKGAAFDFGGEWELSEISTYFDMQVHWDSKSPGNDGGYLKGWGTAAVNGGTVDLTVRDICGSMNITEQR